MRGTLFGAALGDAAGLATEFLSATEAKEFYGEDADFRPGRAVFPDEHRMMWCAGDWTDDTDQQILMMQSLLHSGGHADPCDFATRLLSWRTSGFPELGDQSAAGLGQTTKAVLNDPGFAASPHTAAAAHSAGIPSNGGVMRTIVAIFAISCCDSCHNNPSFISCILHRFPRGPQLRGSHISGVKTPWLQPQRRFASQLMQNLDVWPAALQLLSV